MTTEITAARFGIKHGYVDGDNGWGAGVNYDLALLDVMLNPYLLSITTTTPPTTPTDGDSYYVPTAGVTDPLWSSHTGKIAAYQNGQWNYYTVPSGLRAFVVDTAAFYYMNVSGSWIAEPSSPGSYVSTVAGRSGDVVLSIADVTGAAPINSPTLTGSPSAPTPATTDAGTRIATKDYVDAQVVSRTAGVTSVNTKTGAVTLTAADVGAATSADIASALTGYATYSGVGGMLAGYATQTYVNDQIAAASGGGGATALSGLSDVSETSPTTGDRLHYNGTHWVNGREPYIVALFVPSTQTANQVLACHAFAQAVTFPANFGTTTAGEISKVNGLATATASTTLTITKCTSGTDPTVSGNWTSVGTVTIAAGGYNGTFASSGGAAVNFAQGDKMKVTSSGDTTFANMFLTLAADR